MRVFLVLLRGSRPDDLLFLQIKQAGPSVYEAFLAAEPLPQPRPAGDGGPAVHPELDGHLRRLDHACRGSTSTSASSAT